MDDSVNTFQRIQILLAEYTTLRAEMLSRYAAQFQSTGSAALVFLGFVTLIANKGVGFGLLIVLDVLIWLAALFWIDVNIATAAQRLRELEEEINTMATSSSLLKWEKFVWDGGRWWRFGERYLKWQERKNRLP